MNFMTFWNAARYQIVKFDVSYAGNNLVWFIFHLLVFSKLDEIVDDRFYGTTHQL